MFQDADVHQEQWNDVWDQHQLEVYQFYEQAYYDHVSSSTLNEGHEKGMTQKPVAHYDLSDHLNLINLNSKEFIVTVPGADTSLLVSKESSSDAAHSNTESTAKDNCTSADAQSNCDIDNHPYEGSDDDTVSFTSAVSDLASNFHGTL